MGKLVYHSKLRVCVLAQLRVVPSFISYVTQCQWCLIVKQQSLIVLSCFLPTISATPTFLHLHLFLVLLINLYQILSFSAHLFCPSGSPVILSQCFLPSSPTLFPTPNLQLLISTIPLSLLPFFFHIPPPLSLSLFHSLCVLLADTQQGGSKGVVAAVLVCVLLLLLLVAALYFLSKRGRMACRKKEVKEV